uniref:Uncharacterized protein n=1 Tax=Gasterosteus aculeatus aculeatus TaxID=481459 RepID=A0AAQ4Q1J7_GASAC
MDVAPPAEDPYCRQFHPNTFDPSRCGSCLRPDRMHLGDQSITAATTEPLQSTFIFLVCMIFAFCVENLRKMYR